MPKNETTYKERYYKFIAFVLQSQPQNPEAITPEIIAGVTGCTLSYAYKLEDERLGKSWCRIKTGLDENTG